MFLKRSEPKLPSSSTSIFDLSSVSSGIMGGGGPAGRGFSVIVAGTTMLDLLLPADSLLRNRLNQPLDRLDFLDSEKLPLLRDSGLSTPLTAPSSPLAYALCSRVRLNSRRMLPGRFDRVGDAGDSSAERFVPAGPVVEMVRVRFEAGDDVSSLPFAVDLASAAGAVSSFFFSTTAAAGLGAAGAFSCTGEGRGGGMSVPSVRDANLKSRAGSSNRFPVAAPFLVAMVQEWAEGRVAVDWVTTNMEGSERERERESVCVCLCVCRVRREAQSPRLSKQQASKGRQTGIEMSRSEPITSETAEVREIAGERVRATVREV